MVTRNWAAAIVRLAAQFLALFSCLLRLLTPETSGCNRILIGLNKDYFFAFIYDNKIVIDRKSVTKSY